MDTGVRETVITVTYLTYGFLVVAMWIALLRIVGDEWFQNILKVPSDALAMSTRKASNFTGVPFAVATALLIKPIGTVPLLEEPQLQANTPLGQPTVMTRYDSARAWGWSR